MRPCRSGSWTWGRRTTDALTPCVEAAAAAASSDAARGNSLEVIAGASSVAGVPGGTLAIAVPEVTIKGRCEPARTEPSASTTRRSVSQFACELREVMVESEVDDSVRAGGAVFQAVRI